MPTYRISPPAKLNLFLEILGRRPDGFHELDTVMVAIDWRDELSVTPSRETGIRLEVEWLPDIATIARQLLVGTDDPILHVPDDDSNLVYRALQLITEATGFPGGWDVKLGKRIPSGAGMGGASSDAAATLRLAAKAISQWDPGLADRCDPESLRKLAEQLGSDVPFFLEPPANTNPTGVAGQNSLASQNAPQLARARGRGEKLSFWPIMRPHQFVVVFPGVALSTPEVYRHCEVTLHPRTSDHVIDAFCSGGATPTSDILYNALELPARGLAPRIGEALDCLPVNLSTQSSMTGSGSACFAWITNPDEEVEPVIARITNTLVGGALIRPVVTCTAAPEIQIA